MFSFRINLTETKTVSSLDRCVCRIIHSAGPGVAAVDGFGSNGDVIGVRSVPVTAAQTVCLFLFIWSWVK